MNKAFNLSTVLNRILALTLIIGFGFFIGEESSATAFDLDREVLTACFLSPNLASLAFIPAGVAQGLDVDLAKNNLYDSCLGAIDKESDESLRFQAPELCEHLVQVEGMCITGQRDQVLRRLKWQWAGAEEQEAAPLKSSTSLTPQRGHPYDAFSCVPKSGVSCSEI